MPEDDFRTLVVLEFAATAKKQAADWLVDRIRLNKIRDGLELDAQVLTDEDTSVSFVIFRLRDGHVLHWETILWVMKNHCPFESRPK
jgi:hypothetical protein